MTPWILAVGLSLLPLPSQRQAVAPETPLAPVGGLRAWLRAEDGVVAGLSGLAETWRDRGEGSLDLIQSAGASRPWLDVHGLGGRPALRFDGNDSLGRGDGFPTGSYTIALACALGGAGQRGNLLAGFDGRALFHDEANLPCLLHGGTVVHGTEALVPGETTVLVATFDLDLGEGRLYLDGRTVGRGPLPPTSDRGLRVGAVAGSLPLLGSVGEVLIYDRLLDPGERGHVTTYLRRRFQDSAAPVVELELAPRPGQVFQRDGRGGADVRLRGVVRSSGFDAIELELYRQGALWRTVSQPLVHGAGGAPFDLVERVEAGLFDHLARLVLRDGARRLPVAERANLTCGDVYLMGGQSNAVAADYHLEGLANGSRSPWIRSFGSGSPEPSSLATDLHWDLADGLGFHGHATVGAWGLRWAESLVNDHGVPIALLNGAIGGTSIAVHQRNDLDPTDPTTIYGRLLARAREAGIAAGARALLWYQGEADLGSPVPWAEGFQSLHSAWTEDYPGLEAIYLFQVREGCGFTGNGGVREVQRNLPASYGNVRLMSTTAAPDHDGCHFRYTGYRELGERLARVVSRDLYGATLTGDLDPPDVASAAWSSPARDSIVLVFRDPDDGLLWEPGSEAYFELDDPGVTVTSGQALGHTLTLSLSGASTATTISYLGHLGNGPWITNARGVGALTFFDVPIQP